MICAAAVIGHLHWNTDLAMELFLPVGITPTRMLGVTGANWGRLMLTPLCCWVLSSSPLITSLNNPSPPTVITLYTIENNTQVTMSLSYYYDCISINFASTSTSVDNNKTSIGM
jgi:hypothetical protein